jgi:adenylate cyclase
MNTPTQRRLAAIVSADVVGYSRLMGVDEIGTLAALRAHRAELIDAKIAEHGGRIVKTMGDGLLLEFPSVVDATTCAIEVQEGMAIRNAEVAGDKRIIFRIGINLGDIILDGDDIHGDGVNVAARLQEIAEPGGIAISRRVHEDVRDRLEVSFKDVGEQTLKNIARPVQVWRWPGTPDPAGLPGTPRTGEARAGRREADSSLKSLLDAIKRPTIAVLPFNNMSSNDDLAFFCDGLTESLITDLSNKTGLSVTARNTSFRYKGQTVDVPEVARDLGVDYLVEGSVQAMGQRLRINVQLIDGANGDHLWAKRYDYSTEDLFQAQDKLCANVVVELDTAIATGEPMQIGLGSDSAEATRHLQYSLIHLFRYDREGLAIGQRSGDAAIAADPNYLAALSSTASARVIRAMCGWATDPETLIDEARALRARAADIDPDYPLGFLAEGFIDLACGDYDAAVETCGRAADRDPSLAALRHVYARTLIAVGRYDEAYREARTAISLQPSTLGIFLASLGISCLLAGRVGDAVLVLMKFRELMPQSAYLHPLAAAALVADGQNDAARTVVREVLAIDPSIRVADVLAPYPLRDAEPRERLAAWLVAAGMTD